MAEDQVRVEMVGDVIMARIRGAVTHDMLSRRHQRILGMARETDCRKLLLDDLEMDAMPYEMLEAQRILNVELDAEGFRIAILVPNSRLAYLARLKFDGNHYRVFYNDMAQALAWLNEA